MSISFPGLFSYENLTETIFRIYFLFLRENSFLNIINVKKSPAGPDNCRGFRSVFCETGYSAGQVQVKRTGDRGQEIRIFPSSLCITCFFFDSEISA